MIFILELSSNKNIKLAWLSFDQQPPVVGSYNSKIFQDVWELLASQIFVPIFQMACIIVCCSSGTQECLDSHHVRLFWPADKRGLELSALVPLQTEAVKLKHTRWLCSKETSVSGPAGPITQANAEQPKCQDVLLWSECPLTPPKVSKVLLKVFSFLHFLKLNLASFLNV